MPAPCSPLAQPLPGVESQRFTVAGHMLRRQGALVDVPLQKRGRGETQKSSLVNRSGLKTGLLPLWGRADGRW